MLMSCKQTPSPPPPQSSSLLEAIYERYSELNEYCAECCGHSSSPPPPAASGCETAVEVTTASSPSDSSSSASASPLSSASSSPTDDNSGSNTSSPVATNHPISSSTSPTSNSIAVSTTNEHVLFFIPTAYSSPRKSRSESTSNSVRVVSMSLVLTGLGINTIGNTEELANVCHHVLELDLSKNELADWNEVKKLLGALKKLRLLNLSSNKLKHHEENTNNNNDEEEKADEKIEIDNDENNEEDTQMEEKSPVSVSVSPGLPNPFKEWPVNSTLGTLILNACQLDLSLVESLLERLPMLTELHLASNDYTSITFSPDFRQPGLKVLYFNNNQLRSWRDVCKLGVSFPSLETLVISENHIDSLTSDVESDVAAVFGNLNVLIANKLKINDWSSIDHLRKFPALRHVRIQNIPLLESLTDEEKYFVLVGHLDETIHSLNGSYITSDDKENCERKYLRYFMDVEKKPSRYFELESKHGKLDRLADVNLEIRKKVNVKIKYNGKYVHDKIDVRQTVGDFKKYLEKYVGLPSNRFKVFYIDIEAFSVYGPEELKHANRCLYSFNVRDHDEFEIDLKPAPSTTPLNSSSSANSVLNYSESGQLPYSHLHHLHFHHYNSHMNNNSQYHMPSYHQHRANADQQPTKPISISSSKASSSTFSSAAKAKSSISDQNSQSSQQSNKCCCANNSKSRRSKPLMSIESRPSFRQQQPKKTFASSPCFSNNTNSNTVVSNSNNENNKTTSPKT